MKKISTLFKKDDTLTRVINEVDPANEWALTEGVATVKIDGTACMVSNNLLYKRYDAKHGKPAPVDGIPCQDSDPITGHWPHWVKVDANKPEDRAFVEGFFNYASSFGKIPDAGTYELIGPKVQGNPERVERHTLVRHGAQVVDLIRDFESIKIYLTQFDVEGLVFHHPDGRMCKIRKCDFGITRNIH